MTTFRIESGVPVPPRPPARLVYPFGSMKVGDSFFINTAETSLEKVTSAAWSRHYRTKGEFCFCVRREGEGYRLWRIE